MPKGARRGRLVLIDAHSLIYRAFFALPPMSTSQGQVTNAVYGFTSMLAIVLADRPEYAIAAFDVGKPTFRSQEYAEYKQGRRPMPDDLRSQMELVRKVLESLAIPGLGFETEPKRLYPNDAIAAHLLGFVNDDGVGQYGIEGAYDAVLRGTPGRLVVERDPQDRELALGLRLSSSPTDGDDLTLTIDLVVQTSAERALRDAVAKEHATGGSVVVLDPRDGAVLALASYPSYEPGNVARADPAALMDRAVSWTYEPGSTMKGLLASIALGDGAITPHQLIYCEDGSYRVGGCFLLVVHPFCIGRHPRIAMLDELFGYIESFPNVWFGTHLEVAEEWRRIQVEQGMWDAHVAAAAH